MWKASGGLGEEQSPVGGPVSDSPQKLFLQIKYA